jgi:predicted ATPase
MKGIALVVGRLGELSNWHFSLMDDEAAAVALMMRLLDELPRAMKKPSSSPHPSAFSKVGYKLSSQYDGD